MTRDLTDDERDARDNPAGWPFTLRAIAKEASSFIAAARSAVPRLVESVRALGREASEMRQSADYWRSRCYALQASGLALADTLEPLS